MTVNGKISGGSLYIFLSGELDEYNAALVRGEVDALIEKISPATASCSTLPALSLWIRRASVF